MTENAQANDTATLTNRVQSQVRSTQRANNRRDDLRLAAGVGHGNDPIAKGDIVIFVKLKDGRLAASARGDRECLAILYAAKAGTRNRNLKLDIRDVNRSGTEVDDAIVVKLEGQIRTPRSIVNRESLAIGQSAGRTTRRWYANSLVDDEVDDIVAASKRAVVVKLERDVIDAEDLAVAERGRSGTGDEETGAAVELESSRHIAAGHRKRLAVAVSKAILDGDIVGKTVVGIELESDRSSAGRAHGKRIAISNLSTVRCGKRVAKVEFQAIIGIEREGLAIAQRRAVDRPQFAAHSAKGAESRGAKVHLASRGKVEPQTQVLAPRKPAQRNACLSPITRVIKQRLHAGLAGRGRELTATVQSKVVRIIALAEVKLVKQHRILEHVVGGQ